VEPGLIERPVNTLWQHGDGFAQRSGQLAPSEIKPFILPIHRPFVRHSAKHHVRVCNEVFVDLERNPVAVDVLGKIQPGGTVWASSTQLAKKMMSVVTSVFAFCLKGGIGEDGWRREIRGVRGDTREDESWLCRGCLSNL